jgi:hypothetical protein
LQLQITLEVVCTELTLYLQHPLMMQQAAWHASQLIAIDLICYWQWKSVATAE